jgi:hypothetical protein
LLDRNLANTDVAVQGFSQKLQGNSLGGKPLLSDAPSPTKKLLLETLLAVCILRRESNNRADQLNVLKSTAAG